MNVTVNGISINYERAGRGAALIFVHGWGGSHNSLKDLITLAARDFDAITLDLPGFGKSGNPPADWGVGEYANIVYKFTKQLGLNDVYYFGHSFGGSLGIYLAAHRPDFIKKLVLCASSYKRTARPKTASGLLHQLKHAPALQPFKKLAYRILYPQSDALRFPHLENNFRNIVTEDLTPLIAKIKQPTLILWGEADSMTPLAWAHELHHAIADSHLVTFPNIGHGLPLTHAEVVYKEVKKWLY